MGNMERMPEATAGVVEPDPHAGLLSSAERLTRYKLNRIDIDLFYESAR